jgi:hypothetical protein
VLLSSRPHSEFESSSMTFHPKIMQNRAGTNKGEDAPFLNTSWGHLAHLCRQPGPRERPLCGRVEAPTSDWVSVRVLKGLSRRVFRCVKGDPNAGRQSHDLRSLPVLLHSGSKTQPL